MNKNNMFLGIAAVSFVFLGCVAAFNYSKPIDKQFSPENFYKGDSYDSSILTEDPKAYYKNFNPGLSTDTEAICSAIITRGNQPKMTPTNLVWPSDGNVVKNADEVKAYYTVTEQPMHAYCFKDDEFILAPGDIKFTNSNILQADENNYTIEGVVGKYYFEFGNVKNWWCHLNKKTSKKHTVQCGKGASAMGGIEDVSKGVIIGQATEKSYVAVYKYDNDTKGEQVPIEDIFISDKGVPSDGSSNTTNTTEGLSNGDAIRFNPNWTYGSFSKINTGESIFYKTTSQTPKGKTIAVNAGHGTSGGESAANKTQSHPDGSPKIEGGTNAAGSTESIAVSSGMSWTSNGTVVAEEATVNLKVAKYMKDELLARGYNVLMIRDGNDVQLDNVARTVMANNGADIHVAIHFNSTNDDCSFFMSVTDNGNYKNMEPVKSHWKQHDKLGQCLVDGLSGVGRPTKAAQPNDLTQTSYSTIPSVDVECGDHATNISDETLLKTIAQGLCNGVDKFFE